MSQPLAYFITWTTYGTWLHGDERCSVDRKNNSPDTDRLPPDPRRVAIERSLMKSSPQRLSGTERAIVTNAIVEHAAHRSWEILEVNVRTKHVHVVLKAFDVPTSRVRDELKAYATRALNNAGFARPHHTWTRGGSCRAIDSQDSLNEALDYVLNQ